MTTPNTSSTTYAPTSKKAAWKRAAWKRAAWMGAVFTLALLLFGALPAIAQTTYFAAPTGSGGGTSWADAAAIEDAVATAASGDTIKLQKGRYLLTGRLHTAAHLVGGYPGADEDETPDPFPNPTEAASIDPDADATTLDGQGQTGIARFYGGGATNIAFQNGQAERGAAITVEAPPAAVQLVRIQLLQNTATRAGGAIYAKLPPSGAGLRLEASKLVANTSGTGGALHMEGEMEGEAGTVAASEVLLNTFDGNTTEAGPDRDVTLLGADQAVLANNIAENVSVDELTRAVITQRVTGAGQYDAGTAPQPTGELVARVDGQDTPLRPQGDTLRVPDGYDVELVNNGSTDFIERFSAYNETLGEDISGQPIPQDWKAGEIPREVDYAAGPTASNPGEAATIVIPNSDLGDLKEIQAQLIPAVSPEGKNTLDTYTSAVNDPEDDRSGIFVPRTTPDGSRTTPNGDDLNQMVTYISTDVLGNNNTYPEGGDKLQKWRDAVELISAELPYDVEIRYGDFDEINSAYNDRANNNGDAQNLNYVYFKDAGTPSNFISPPDSPLKNFSIANVVEGEEFLNRFRNEYYESMNGKDDFFEAYDEDEEGIISPSKDMNFLLQTYYTSGGEL